MAAEQSGSAGDHLTDAGQIKLEVDELVERARQRFEPAILKGRREWAKSKLIAEQSFANLGLLLYAVLSVVGMSYVTGFYLPFDIAVLDFFETPDFLLSAASSWIVVLMGIGAVVLVLLLLLTIYSEFVASETYRGLDDETRVRHFRTQWIRKAFLALALLFGPAAAGAIHATVKACLLDESDFVGVTLRDDSPVAGPTILLGTSNKFHFFYQCKVVAGASPICATGEPFIVATDNVAAVAYDHNRGSDTPPPPPSDVALAIGGLADAVSHLDANTTINVDSVEATLDTEELTKAIDALTETSKSLTVKTRVESSELTVKALVDPSEVTIRAELPESTIPWHAHLDAPFVVLPSDVEPVSPVYVVPFPPLSPFDTFAAGVSVPRRTGEWLHELYRSLSDCEDARVTVTGYASRQGFGDPQDQSPWAGLNDETTAHMNCGLANLRALSVVEKLFGASRPEDDVSMTVRTARGALEKDCKIEFKACLEERNDVSDEACKCLKDKADSVQRVLNDLCSQSIPREWPGERGTGPEVHVRAWEGPTETWSWLDDGASRLLRRSVHITLDADPAACPQMPGLGASLGINSVGDLRTPAPDN